MPAWPAGPAAGIHGSGPDGCVLQLHVSVCPSGSRRVRSRAQPPSGPSRLFDDSIGALEELVSCLPFVHFFGQCEIWWTTKARVSTMLATKDNCNVAVVAQSSHGDWFGGQKNISPILFIKLTTSRDVASQSCLKLRIINTLCVGWDGAPST